MAAPRPDVKYYLDTEEHAALKVFADHEGLTLAQLTEQVMRAYLRKRVHEVSVVANKLQRAGIIQNEGTGLGTGRK